MYGPEGCLTRDDRYTFLSIQSATVEEKRTTKARLGMAVKFNHLIILHCFFLIQINLIENTYFLQDK